MVQLKDDRQRDGAVDSAQHVLVQLGGFLRDIEYLDFRHTAAGRQVNGFRCQLVGPSYLLDLADKLIAQCRGNGTVLVDFALRHHAGNPGLRWETE
ncbi:hypothetical protein D3C84_741250 [compost metagenome]